MNFKSVGAGTFSRERDAYRLVRLGAFFAATRGLLDVKKLPRPSTACYVVSSLRHQDCVVFYVC